MGAAAGWVAGVLCLAVSAVAALSAIAHRESARADHSMEGDRR